MSRPPTNPTQAQPELEEAVERVIHALRERISDADRAIVSALNRRLELALELRRYKETHGIPFVDPEREEWIHRDLARFNRGPLSQPELTAFVTELFALTKREIARL